MASIEEQIELYKTVFAEITEGNKEILMQIKQIASEVFGKEYVELRTIDISKYSGHDRQRLSEFDKYKVIAYHNIYGAYSLVIHFPSVRITNNEGRAHDITNLFVNVKFDTEVKFKSLEGMRSTFTADEFLSDYTHSHLSGICTSFSENFCTGSGPINQSITLLKLESFDPIEFRMFCYHIKMMVKHESLEGTPYRYISAIGTSKALSRRPDDAGESFSRNFKKYCLRKLIATKTIEEIKSSISAVVGRDKIIIKPSEKLEILLADIISTAIQNREFNTNNDFIPYLLCTKNSRGEYTEIAGGSNTINNSNIGQTVIVFKGKEYKLEILIPEDNQKNFIQYAHPNITEYVCDNLADYFTKAAYRFSKVHQ